MLAGLLFANEDADDRPEVLAATLPFGGATLIEFQARLLIAAGAAQIVVAVTRATPELAGAINRIARRGVPVDMVRTAAETLEKVHPLATVLMLAGGLVTTEAIVARMAEGEGDALLVVDEDNALPRLERVDARTLWAGVARFGPRRLADAARLPEEYDLQSTLLRVAAPGAARIVLPQDASRAGHGIERDSRALAQRGRRAIGARLAARRSWVDRFVLAPLARAVLPPLIERAAPAAVPATTGAALAALGCILVALRWPAAGLITATVGVLALAVGQALSSLRGDSRAAVWQERLVSGAPALAALLLGGTISRDAGTATGWLAAVTLVVAAALLERAARRADRRPWWGSPPAYLLLLTLLTILGEPLAGLILACAYAAAGLAQAIERPQQP